MWKPSEQTSLRVLDVTGHGLMQESADHRWWCHDVESNWFCCRDSGNLLFRGWDFKNDCRHPFSRCYEVVNSRGISGFCRKVDEAGCPGSSVRNYHYTLHNIAKECKSSKFIYEENVLSTVSNYRNMLPFPYTLDRRNLSQEELPLYAA